MSQANNPLYRKILVIVGEQLWLEPDKIRPESHLINDLGAGDLELAELQMQLEEDFDLQIPDEEMAQFHTIQDVYNYIDRLQAIGASIERRKAANTQPNES